MIQTLADADEFGVVRQVQEFYADVIPIDKALFSLNSQRLLSSSVGRPSAAILSIFLALKTRPSDIRFTSSSQATRALGTEIAARLAADDLHDYPLSADSPVLLILDRKSDPVTPLLSQWTYQAMVHELLGLNNGRVLLPDISEGEVTMSGRDDTFFDENKYQNFGDLGAAIRELMQKFAKEHRVQTDVKSIDDMRSFMDKYPAFRSQSSRVSKHVTITSELSRLVETCSLFEISALEQDLACSDDHPKQHRELLDMLAAPAISAVDKLRLGLLYALHYETSADLPQLKERMVDGGVPREQVELLDKMIQYAGQAQRPPGLYGEAKGLLGRIKKNLHGGVVGVENVYTRHVPLMAKVLCAAFKGTLNESHYPVAGFEADSRGAGGGGNRAATRVVVWIVGGATYEESAHISSLNNGDSGISVILGGSCVHNSSSFLRELAVAPIR